MISEKGGTLDRLQTRGVRDGRTAAPHQVYTHLVFIVQLRTNSGEYRPSAVHTVVSNYLVYGEHDGEPLSPVGVHLD